MLTSYSKKFYVSYLTYIGETFESLKYLYRIPSQTIGKIVPETCQAIVDVLCEDYLKVCGNQYSYMYIYSSGEKEKIL